MSYKLTRAQSAAPISAPSSHRRDIARQQVNRLSSFELFRRSVRDVEVLTSDELFERARGIVGDDLN